jgi:hypothetical protein
MGYNLHITRRERWSNPVPNDITYEEWKQLADVDPEFRVCGSSRWLVNVRLREADSEPEPPEEIAETYDDYGLLTSGDYPSFGYHDGRVVVRGPNDAVTARKIFEVAGKLSAVVQGDEGEYYRLTDDILEPIQERPEPSRAVTPEV